MSNRNMVRQEVPLKNEEGEVVGKKAIFHQKQMSKPQYADRKKFWDMTNQTPKENSKRQKKLRGELVD